MRAAPRRSAAASSGAGRQLNAPGRPLPVHPADAATPAGSAASRPWAHLVDRGVLVVDQKREHRDRLPLLGINDCAGRRGTSCSSCRNRVDLADQGLELAQRLALASAKDSVNQLRHRVVALPPCCLGSPRRVPRPASAHGAAGPDVPWPHARDSLRAADRPCTWQASRDSSLPASRSASESAASPAVSSRHSPAAPGC